MYLSYAAVLPCGSVSDFKAAESEDIEMDGNCMVDVRYRCRRGANPAASAAPPTLPFTTQIKRIVVFIQTDCRVGEGVVSHVGTGFFVFVPEPRLSGDVGFFRVQKGLAKFSRA